MSRATIIVNEAAGSAGEGRQTIERALAGEPLDADVVVVPGPGIRAAAERAASTGGTLVAAGGDGTVSAVASVAVAARRTFGVIPLGTLNHFARDAGIPLDVAGAVRTLAAGRPVPLDVGILGDRTFLNNVSLGFYVRLVRERQDEQRRGHRKWTAFAIGLARAWADFRTLTVRLTVDGQPLVRRTPFVFVGNGDYKAEGLEAGSRTSLAGGRLTIYVAPECGRIELVGLSLRALLRRLTPDVKLECFNGAHVTIETASRRLTAALDGELIAASPPLRCAIQRGALTTLLPVP